ncbi:hypothetical protein ACDW_19530 [Acidovorax sp. DW039]|uniref:hypothetical protein n=1 Tax=Acidovorax sp. DW039 TaxID=3095606 RepID=UPI00308A3850|nr:hypothetical protein ACDW_19530 [Acidovorax sp. DW039]
MQVLKAATNQRRLSVVRSTAATFVGLLLGVCASQSAWALTVSGSIAANTRWTAAQSPIMVQGNVTLDQDATLTVDPGVQIRMEPSSSFTVMRGAVRAVGTQDQPIVITSAKSSPAPGDWGVWRFTEGTRNEQTQWDYVRVEYGSGLVVEKSSPTLNRVSLRFNNGPAVRIDLESSPVGKGLTAEGNLINAVLVPAGVITGKVSWALAGIPYFVEQGLVEVGLAQMLIEPAEVKMPRNSNVPLRLKLTQPAPQGGRDLSFVSSASYIVQGPGVLRVPEGASEVNFNVSSLSQLGAASISVSHPELGTAGVRVEVADIPSIDLRVLSSSNQMLAGAPYTLTANLSVPAPSGGVTVPLSSTPVGAVQHPASVTIAEGESSATFVVQGAASGTTATVSAQAAAGYAIREGAVDLEFVSGLYAELLAPSRMLVGEQLEISVRQVVPPAPKGGLKAQMDSSAPSVLKVIVNEASVSGEELYPQTTPPFLVQAIAPGEARLQLSGAGFMASPNNVTVVKPTELYLEAYSENGKFVIGEGLVGRVRVGRKVEPLSYHAYSDGVYVTLACEDSSICSTQSVYIPSWQQSVMVSITGNAAGATKLRASAEYAVAAIADVNVVKPELAWSVSRERYMGVRQGFSICLSVPNVTSSYYRQELSASAWVMDLSLPDQAPIGLVGAIYNQPEGGSSVTQARIETGSSCTNTLYVGEASRRGSYRIGLNMANGMSSKSEAITVLADDQIAMRAVCGDCVELTVVQGFTANFGAYATYRGLPQPPSQPLSVQIVCADVSGCSATSPVELMPNEEYAYFEVTGLSPGRTSLEATVPASLDVYPDVGSRSIRVVPPSLSFDSRDWQTPEVDVTAGESRTFEVCLSEPGWGVRSYSLTDMNIQMSTSNPAVARVTPIDIWPAKQECVYLEMNFISAGVAQLTVNVPGVPTHTKRFEVQP